MFLRIVLISTLFFISCGQDGIPGLVGRNGDDGSSCTTEQTNNGANIKCTDGTVTSIQNGKDGVNGKNGIDGKDGANGKNGIDGKDFTPQVTDFSGYWVLPNGGYIEFVKTDDQRFIIYSTQRIYTKNFDDGLALYPALWAGPHYVKKGVIQGETRPNYDATINDLEVDGTTHNITGYRKTVYNFSLNENKKLVIRIIVYSSNGLKIESDRTIISE